MLHSYHSDSPPWRLLPPPDQRQALAMRRSNLVVIAVLLFFTLGLLIVGFVPLNSHASDTGKAAVQAPRLPAHR